MNRLDFAELPCESQISFAIWLMCSLIYGGGNVILHASNIFMYYLQFLNMVTIL